jgi:ER membrane protein complex subunit 1
MLLGDDSILLKYRNPHFMVLASIHSSAAESSSYNASSLSDDAHASSMLILTLIDTVNARVLHRIEHMHGSEPVQGSFVDGNSFVVSYWNSKAKRTELSSVSLFEGLVDRYSLNPLATPATSTTMQQLHRNSNASAFSSSPPLVMQRTYWLPKVMVTGLHTTVTTAGITNKNIIASLNTGQLIMLDMRLINARRPTTTATAAEKEEGLQEYHPMILLQAAQSYISLNQGKMALALVPLLIVTDLLLCDLSSLSPRQTDRCVCAYESGIHGCSDVFLRARSLLQRCQTFAILRLVSF